MKVQKKITLNKWQVYLSLRAHTYWVNFLSNYKTFWDMGQVPSLNQMAGLTVLKIFTGHSYGKAIEYTIRKYSKPSVQECDLQGEVQFRKVQKLWWQHH